MQSTTRRVAVIGGNRIPFARSNTVYAHASNQDMLTAAIDGLVGRYVLEGERLGEVVAGAVLKHARDFNLTRESVLGTRLAPELFGSGLTLGVVQPLLPGFSFTGRIQRAPVLRAEVERQRELPVDRRKALREPAFIETLETH